MKKSLFLLLCLVVGLGSTAFAQEVNPQTPYVQVRGNAERYVEPDRFSVQVNLSEADSKGKISLAALESQFAKALNAAKIDQKKNLTLISQSSDAQKRQQIYSYKTYSVTVGSVDELNILFDALRAKDIANAEILRVWNTKQQEIINELRVEAVKNAKSLAEQLASALGQTIGKALIVTSDSYAPIAFSNNMSVNRAAFGSNDAVAAPKLETAQFRKQLFNQSVEIRFELK